MKGYHAVTMRYIACALLASALLLSCQQKKDASVETGNVLEATALSAPKTAIAEATVPELMEALDMYRIKEPWDAPDFELSALDGEKVELSQLRGNVVLLSFWTTW
jgi:cytochrome oxidase Cu insertion factor (SCO1/SenC/PrrC family)